MLFTKLIQKIKLASEMLHNYLKELTAMMKGYPKKMLFIKSRKIK